MNYSNEDLNKLAELGIKMYECRLRWQDNDFDWHDACFKFVTKVEVLSFWRDVAEFAERLYEDNEVLGAKMTIWFNPPGENRQWITGWDLSKERVASPDHNVFIVIGGRDCDGMIWREYLSFDNLADAANEVEDIFMSADGPTSYNTLSRDDWEAGSYPEYRDRFAERMGY